MTFAAYVIACILFPVAILHIFWAFGVKWPAKTEEMLIKTVIGHPKAKKMPSRSLTLVVAAGIAAAGFVALLGAHVIESPFPLSGWSLDIMIVVLAFIFGLRGLSSYVMDGPLGQRIEPFATLDRHYFAPLCFLLSACFCFLFFA